MVEISRLEFRSVNNRGAQLCGGPARGLILLDIPVLRTKLQKDRTQCVEVLGATVVRLIPVYT